MPNAATLIVGDQRIRPSGIDPGPIEVLGPFENWVKAQGDLSCEPDAQTGRYHCLTSSGVDVAEAAILNGAGRVGDGAAPEYRDSEAQARNAKRGLLARTLKSPKDYGGMGGKHEEADVGIGRGGANHGFWRGAFLR